MRDDDDVAGHPVCATFYDPLMKRAERGGLGDRRAAEPPSFPVEVIEAGAEELPLEDASVDTLISTLVFCTVGDPGRAAAEVARVTAPGGRLLLFEHVRDPGEGRKARWQDRLERFW